MMSREQRTETREGQGRKQRIPLHAAQQKLAASSRPGMKSRWVNDDGGRLQQFEAAGYSFQTEDTTKTGSNADPGTRISRIVGRDDHGNPVRAYLMEQTQENYDEDQKAKQRQLDAFDEAMKRGQPSGGSDENTYVKTHSVERR
jgi:hypothetical protein